MAEASQTRHGPGRVLIAVYAVFALAASARATVQIATKYDDARLAYTLSAVAALVYVAATVALARATRASRRVATVACAIEFAGVVVIGLYSYLAPERFPDATVWSHFGQGYLFIPLVLPLLGLAWLRQTR